MYFSKEMLIHAFKDLGHITDGTGKKAVEVTSALRYLIATSALNKKYTLTNGLDLSISNPTLRAEFIEEVGEVVKIHGSTYTNNFIKDFLSNANFAVGNNFLTTRLKTDGDYPGRPAPVLHITNQTVKIHDAVDINLLKSYHNFKESIVPLNIWLLRNCNLTLTEDLDKWVEVINEKLAELYEDRLFSVLKIRKEDLETYFSKIEIKSLKELISPVKYNFLDFISSLSTKVESSAATNIIPIIHGENKIYFGAPGTGKSHYINEVIDEISENNKERVTFHPEYDHASFVGGYKPTSDNGNVKYAFVAQVFTDVYVKAWKDVSNEFFLIIEEINRGNCAEIFGFLFQILDRRSNYAVTPPKELKEYLEKQLGSDHDGIFGGKMRMPTNLSIYATMNTSDQSLFPMDSAFKRRWSWEYVPICYDETTENGSINKSFYNIVKFDDDSSFKWIDFIKIVNNQIKSNPNLGSDKCLGNYFVYADSGTITLIEFINKVIFYLWIDVFKDEEETIFDEHQTYEDFFPIISNGKKNVKSLLDRLGVEISVDLL
jgi:hypothetical protein